MATGRATLFVAAAAGLGAGCVDRRFVVETNVPGAQVYVDGAPVGAAPADGRWEYAGWREFTAVAPGYEPLVQRVQFKPRWYEYPPLDLFAEVLWPFRIEDVRRVKLTLEPARPVNQFELLADADGLRNKGRNLPPTVIPPARAAGPKPGPAAAPPPTAPPLAPIPGHQVPATLPLPADGRGTGPGQNQDSATAPGPGLR